MNYLTNPREATLDILTTIVDDEDKKRIYPDNLLKEIKEGKFECLNEVSMSNRNDPQYMGHLLFAVRNSKKTYGIYEFYGETLQKKDLTLAAEIAKAEPKAIEKTKISENETIMLYLAKVNPEVIRYMSSDLKNNSKFIETLCKTEDKDIIRYAASECNLSRVLQDNHEIANNSIVMVAAIKANPTLLAHASEELKNSYEFIKEVSMENREVIDYVAEHADEFGKDALKGAREAVETHFIKDVTRDVTEEKQKLEEEKQKLEEQGKDESAAKEIEKKERDLSSVERTIKTFNETPEEKKPRRASLLLKCIKEENVPKEYRHYIKELRKYEKIYLAEREKEKAEQKEVKEKAQPLSQEKTESEYTIGHDAVEKMTEETTPSKMNEQFEIMAETLEKEKAEKTKEKSGMGVEDDDERPPKVER